jgi:hypothetical protein
MLRLLSLEGILMSEIGRVLCWLMMWCGWRGIHDIVYGHHVGLQVIVRDPFMRCWDEGNIDLSGHGGGKGKVIWSRFS